MSNGWIAPLVLALAPSGPAQVDEPAWSPCIVRVVDAATHEAVAGVEVWWIDPDALEEDKRRVVLDRWLVPEEWIRRFGTSARSDDRGDVAIAKPLSIFDRRMFVAWHAGKFARCDVDHGLRKSRIVALELVDDPGQLVRVRDGRGAPLAGVEVAAWCEEHGICGNCGPGNERIWSAPTDARGEVVLPHADWYFRTTDSQGNLGDRVHLVGLGFPTSKKEWRGIAELRGEPPAIELVAPPLEPLEIEFRSEAGERCTGELPLVLAVGVPRPGSFLGTGSPFGRFVARDGRLSLPHVERGLHFFISSAWDDARGEFIHDVAVPDVDPTTPDAPRVVRANHHYLRLRGRAVDHEGRPIPRAALVADGVRGDQDDDRRDLHLGGVRSRSDEAGRFVFDFVARDWRMVGAKEHRIVAVALASSDEPLSECGTPTRVTIADDADVAAYDLGDVALTPPPLVVGGRVVDESGRPIADVTLFLVQGGPQRGSMAGPMICTDAAGAFSAYDHDHRGPASFLSREPGWRCVGVRAHRGSALGPTDGDVAFGSADVEIVLQQCGGVRGRVLLPDGARADDFEVTVESDARNVDARIDWYPDGAFEVRGPERRIFVGCRSKKDPHAFFRSESVVLPESGLDESIELEIDLRTPRRPK